MPDLPDREPNVVVHKAGSPTEAIVVRGLLEGVGIHLPETPGGDASPANDPLSGTAGVDIEVPQSRAEQARRIIADYLASGENIIIENSEDDSFDLGGG